MLRARLSGVGGNRVIRRLWDRLMVWLRIREPYREPTLGRSFMARYMQTRLEEMERGERWPR